MKSIRFLVLLLVLGVGLQPPEAVVIGADRELFFETDVRPILKSHCFHCHGEETEHQAELDLRLVRFITRGGESGSALLAGAPAESLIWNRIATGEMPPKGKGLSEQEKSIVQTWIAQGARTRRPEPEKLPADSPWTAEERGYWAFQPPVRLPVPVVDQAELVRTPIDNFLLSKLEQHALSYSHEANRETLVRRLSFDLLGLPPDPVLLDEFAADTRPDAYERLVDRMLASPAYGERWARHWLDVAGYADSDGYSEKDTVRPWSFRYRDYVIRSLNESKPVDQWIIEQLAGDELVAPPYENLSSDAVDKLVATGFLRMAPDGTEDGADVNAARNDVMADTIKIVSTSLLGMTIGCAQCHNHRYDPISQVDYYAFRAIFEPALDWKNWRDKNSRMINILVPKEREKAAHIDAQLKELDERQKAELDCIVQEIFDRELEKLPEDLRAKAIAARATKQDERSAEQRQLMKDHPSLNVDRGSAYLYEPDRLNKFNKRWDETKTKKRTERPADERVACLTEVPDKVPATFVFFRGDINQPRDAVKPSLPSIFENQIPIPEDDQYVPTTGRRLAMAKHLTSGQHPLLGRVLVNRIWMHHFGKGIVNTPGDFGVLGERPSHPALLDWMAVELASNGWDLKQLQKTIVCSAAYRQTSTRNPAMDQLDPENRLLGRMSMRRLESEAIRDAAIESAGMRTRTMFGPPAPVNPDDVGQVIVGSATRDGNGIMIAKLTDDPEQYRRSIYVQVRRSMPLGVLEPFDVAALSPNCDRRSASTVATQSLLLMNNQVSVQLAERFAQRVIRDVGDDVDQQIRRARMLACGAGATDADIAGAREFIARQREIFTLRQTSEAAAQAKTLAEKSDVGGKSSAKNEPATSEQLAPATQALAVYCQALISSNQFLYVD